MTSDLEQLLGRRSECLDSIAELNAHDAVIDGEIVALDEKGRSSFQLLQSHDMGHERSPIFFYAFDLLQLNGKDMKKLPLEERKATLQRLLEKPPGVIRFSATLGTTRTTSLKKLATRPGGIDRKEGEIRLRDWNA